MQEKRVVNEQTGGEKGTKLSQLGFAPPEGMRVLGEVYGFGAQKYDPWNYRKGYAWSLSYNAMLRHVWAWMDGEDNDPESGLNHMAHVAWHALALVQFSKDHPSLDDRPSVLHKLHVLDRLSPMEHGVPDAAEEIKVGLTDPEDDADQFVLPTNMLSEIDGCPVVVLGRGSYELPNHIRPFHGWMQCDEGEWQYVRYLCGDGSSSYYACSQDDPRRKALVRAFAQYGTPTDAD